MQQFPFFFIFAMVKSEGFGKTVHALTNFKAKTIYNGGW